MTVLRGMYDPVLRETHDVICLEFFNDFAEMLLL